MKVIYILLGVAVFVTATFTLYLKPEKDKPSASLQQHQVENELGQNVYAHDERLKNKNESSSSHLMPELMPVLEQNVERRMILPESFQHRADTGYLFKFSPDEVASMKEGSKFPLKLLQFGINRVAEITEIEQVEDGIVRYKGQFEDYPADLNYFTITQSIEDQYAIIKVYTDKGSYFAEVIKGIGLAYPDQVLHDDGVHVHQHTH